MTAAADTGAGPGPGPGLTYWDFPYPHYRDLQREDPVHYDPYLAVWLVTSHAAVLEALRHPRLSSAWLARRADVRNQSPAARRVHAVLSRWFVLTDPPEHPRLRAAVGRAFTPRAIAALEPFIRARVDALLGAAAERGGNTDAMTELAVPLSSGVIARLIGVDAEVERRLPRWGAQLAKYLANLDRLDVADATAQVVAEIAEALTAVLEQRTAPEGTLMAHLSEELDGDTPLSVDDIVSTVAFLLYAGLEATANGIGMAVNALLQRPGLCAELRAASPDAMAAAVEELLRFDTSVLQVPRVATADLELCGTHIPEGAVTVLVLGAANHDEARYGEPDAIRVHRAETRHLTFGLGAHFCIGAALARAETAAFLTAFLAGAPEAESAGRPKWSSRDGVRTLESLPVRLGPGAGRDPGVVRDPGSGPAPSSCPAHGRTEPDGGRTEPDGRNAESDGRFETPPPAVPDRPEA